MEVTEEMYRDLLTRVQGLEHREERFDRIEAQMTHVANTVVRIEQAVDRGFTMVGERFDALEAQ